MHLAGEFLPVESAQKSNCLLLLLLPGECVCVALSLTYTMNTILLLLRTIPHSRLPYFRLIYFSHKFSAMNKTLLAAVILISLFHFCSALLGPTLAAPICNPRSGCGLVIIVDGGGGGTLNKYYNRLKNRLIIFIISNYVVNLNEGASRLRDTLHETRPEGG